MQRKKLSLRAQVLVSTLTLVGAGLLATVALLAYQASEMQRHSALLYAEQLAHVEADRVATRLSLARQTARVAAQMLAALKVAGKPDRDVANAQLRAVVEGNPTVLGVGTIWEPNAFDGRDAEFVNAPAHDKSGRLVPYWNRASGKVAVEATVGYDQPGLGDFYLEGIRTGEETLVDPYEYEIAGKKVLVATVSVPIRGDDKFIGSAGIDIAMADIQADIARVQLYDTGYASLISNSGVIVGDRQANRLMQDIEADGSQAGAKAAVKAGEMLKVRWTDAATGEAHTRIYVPVVLSGIKTPWSLAVTVPDAEMLASVTRLRRTAVILAVSTLLLVSIGLALLLERLVLRPLGGEPRDAVNLARRVAEGDLVTPVHVKPGDQGSLMAALAAMQGKLTTLVASVRERAQSVETASGEIALGNEDLSSRTEQQASAIEETAASMEQLTVAVRQSAESARQASDLAGSAAQVAVDGGQVVEGVVSTMSVIDEASRRIAEITGVIDGIAVQTNLLALNAAVEAARAGEHGRGFSVVASEVRSLAQRASEAATKIQRLIDESVGKIQQGSRQAARAGESMHDIVQRVQQVAQIIGGISVSSAEQSAGIDSVSQAVSEMDRMTQQNAALVEEASAATAALKTQATQLAEAVAVFRLRGDARA